MKKINKMQTDTQSATPKRKVLIYVPIAPDQAYLPVQKSKWQNLKSSVARRLEMEMSVRTGKLRLTDYHQARTHYSNKGDIAIGGSIRDAWAHVTADIDCDISLIGWGGLDADNVELINSNYDLLILGGGGYIFLDADGKLNQRKKDLDFLRRINVPIVAHGIGLNRLMHERAIEAESFGTLPPETKRYLKEFSEIVQHISVRDTPTQQLFDSSVNKEVQLTGDPALYWDSIKTVKKSELKSETAHIGINVAAHGWRALHVLREIMPNLEEFYRGLNNQHSMEVSYFLHENLEHPVVEYLHRRGIKFTLVDEKPEHMYDRYRSMKYVVSEMLHSSIMAFSVGTPCINIAYDKKSLAFYDLFDLSKYAVPWSEITSEKLKKLTADLEESLGEVQRQIHDRREFLFSRQNDFLQSCIRTYLK